MLKATTYVKFFHHPNIQYCRPERSSCQSLARRARLSRFPLAMSNAALTSGRPPFYSEGLIFEGFTGSAIIQAMFIGSLRTGLYRVKRPGWDSYHSAAFPNCRPRHVGLGSSRHKTRVERDLHWTETTREKSRGSHRQTGRRTARLPAQNNRHSPIYHVIGIARVLH